MGLRFYDEAISNKIASWVKDPNIRILKPDESTRFFESTFDVTKDQPLSLPLISISRDKRVEILNSQKQSKTFNGFTQIKNEQTAIPINVVPIQAAYQIDIYTRWMAEADEYLRNFIFNLINYPKVEITVPYNNINIKHESTIHLEDEVSDNSDIANHLFADQFTRFTIRFILDDAYLFSLPAKEIIKIESADLEIRSKNDKEIEPIL